MSWINKAEQEADDQRRSDQQEKADREVRAEEAYKIRLIEEKKEMDNINRLISERHQTFNPIWSDLQAHGYDPGKLVIEERSVHRSLPPISGYQELLTHFEDVESTWTSRSYKVYYAGSNTVKKINQPKELADFLHLPFIGPEGEKVVLSFVTDPEKFGYLLIPTEIKEAIDFSKQVLSACIKKERLKG